MECPMKNFKNSGSNGIPRVQILYNHAKHFK